MISSEPKFVPCGIDIDIAGATDNVADSINMKNSHKCTFLVQYVDLAGADHLVLVYSGTTDAARTSALPFRYRFSPVATGTATCDVYPAWTECAATGLTVAHGTYDNFTLQIQVNASAMDTANNEEWLTLDFQDTGDAGATGQAIVWAVLSQRYSQDADATALA